MTKELILFFFLFFVILVLNFFCIAVAKIDSKLEKNVFLSNLSEKNIENILRKEIYESSKYCGNVNVFCETPKSKEGKKILKIFKRKYNFIKSDEDYHNLFDKT